MITLLLAILVSWYLAHSAKKIATLDSLTQHFVLYDDGRCGFSSTQELTLHANSRVGVLGCWLIFEPEKNLKQRFSVFNNKRGFIFKDSVSPQDYARLCRIIYRIKNTDFKKPTVTESK